LGSSKSQDKSAGPSSRKPHVGIRNQEKEGGGEKSIKNVGIISILKQEQTTEGEKGNVIGSAHRNAIGEVRTLIFSRVHMGKKPGQGT